MLKSIIKISCALTLLFLTACATITPAVPAGETAMTWQQRHAQLAAIRNWTLTSAFSVREGTQASIVSLTWQQQGSYFNQRIAGPFNLGGVRIYGSPGHVTLVRSANQQVTASTPEELLQKELNIRLPISNLYYWVRGIPVPGIPASTRFDQYNHLISLQQSGWQVNYVDYTTVNGIDLPKTIQMTNGNLQVKMVIKQWQIQ